MSESGTGWERNQRIHFDEIVENYDAVRPNYPKEIFEDIIKYCGINDTKKAIEIGAGTGKATAPFLNAGYEVTAVELGAHMVAFLSKKFNGHKNFHVINAAFEDATFAEGRYDLIYAATAFHWLNAEIACPKIYSLLKDGGTVALFRYNALPFDGDACYEEIQSIYKKNYYSFYRPYSRPVGKVKEDFKTAAEIVRAFGFEDLRSYGFIDVSMNFYDVSRTFDAEEYVSFLDTLSDHRSLPVSDKTALYSGVKDVIQRHGNCHKVNYIFQLYFGRKK